MIDQGPVPEPEASRLGGARRTWCAMTARSRALVAAGAAAALLASGIAGGAAGAVMLRSAPATFQAGLAATPIAQLSSGGPVALDGKVVEIFGSKFVIDDGTARALVETGRAGEGGDLVAAGEPVTVQGRFEKGFLHASALRHADGDVDELAPPPPPPPGPPPLGRP